MAVLDTGGSAETTCGSFVEPGPLKSTGKRNKRTGRQSNVPGNRLQNIENCGRKTSRNGSLVNGREAGAGKPVTTTSLRVVRS